MEKNPGEEGRQDIREQKKEKRRMNKEERQK
jgi:hypothetical protein